MNITASEMCNIIEEFCAAFDAHGKAPTWSYHYELTGSKSARINESVGKLISHEENFDETDLVFNVITNKVLPEKFAKEFLVKCRNYSAFSYDSMKNEVASIPSSTDIGIFISL